MAIITVATCVHAQKKGFELLIPQPHEVVAAAGTCQVPSAVAFRDAFKSNRLQHQLARVFQDSSFKTGDFLTITKGLMSRGDEAYELKITPARIAITAAKPVGAFYALKTLEQLVRSGKPLPCGTIRDWPDLSFRGVHFMLGGMTPNIETLKMTVVAMANLKLNKIVFEYDNQFPWVNHSECHCAAAYSLEELRNLVALAHDNFIEIIPLVDSLGHCDLYLRKKRNAHLREDLDNFNVLCPQNPESLKFIKELWTEVLAAHPEAKYAHITGDEVHTKKNCPKCQPYTAAGRWGELFCDYYIDLSRWIIRQGKTPIMWGDMFIKYPGALTGFPRDVVICDWNYSGPDGDLISPFYEYDMQGKCDDKRRKLFSPYWQTRASGGYDVFPYLEFFGDQGFKTIAGTCVDELKANSPCNISPVNFNNNMRYALKALSQRKTCLGLLNTSWGYHTVPGFWLPVVAEAEYTWNTRKERYKTFLNRFAAGFLRRPDWSDALYQLSLAQEGKNCKIVIPEGRPGPGAEPMALEFVKVMDLAIDMMKLTQAHEAGNVGGNADQLRVAACANSSLKEALPPKARNIDITSGKYQFHGLSFNLDKQRVISLSSEEPTSVSLPLNRKLSGLVFWVMGYNAYPVKLATMTVQYTDGSSDNSFSFTGVSNMIDWSSRRAPKDADSAIVAWRGRKDSSEPRYTCLTLWRNPHPEREISSIKLSPVMSDKNSRVVILGMNALSGKVVWPKRKMVPPASLKAVKTKAQTLLLRWLKPSYVNWAVNTMLAPLRVP